MGRKEKREKEKTPKKLLRIFLMYFDLKGTLLLYP
jgi:hypothetical protein